MVSQKYKTNINNDCSKKTLGTKRKNISLDSTTGGKITSPYDFTSNSNKIKNIGIDSNDIRNNNLNLKTIEDSIMHKKYKYTYDDNAEALYIYTHNYNDNKIRKKVDKTLSLSENLNIDLDNEGKILGIEILLPDS